MAESETIVAVLGLGANLGERRRNLRNAVDALAAAGVVVLARSLVYETPPAGGPPQPDYLNAAVKVAVSFSLETLLERCLVIERSFGRLRPDPVRNGPRPLDIDVLWSSRGRVSLEGLEIPHPRLAERPFALRPLLDVMPDAADASGRPYRGLPGAQAAISCLGPL